MGHSFENVGVIFMASSKRSLRIELKDSPFTIFKQVAYVSIKDVERVIAGRKKTATIWILKNPNRGK